MALGFCGVVLAADPHGGGRLGPILLALTAACCWGLSVVLVRLIARSETTANQMLVSNALFALACALLVVPMWRTPDPRALALMLGLGLVGGLGQFVLYEGFRYAPASAVASVEYTALIWAFLYGYLFWGDVPGWRGVRRGGPHRRGEPVGGAGRAAAGAPDGDGQAPRGRALTRRTSCNALVDPAEDRAGRRPRRPPALCHRRHPRPCRPAGGHGGPHRAGPCGKPGPSPTTIFLGDYVDRGPASAAVIERLVRRDFPTPIVTLRGNHEDILVGLLRARWTSPITPGSAAPKRSASYGLAIADLAPLDADARLAALAAAIRRRTGPFSRTSASARRWGTISSATRGCGRRCRSMPSIRTT